MIEFHHVGFKYVNSPEILKNINLQIKAGSFHFITGPSGAGKSTLLKLIYLAQKPTVGQVRLFGQLIDYSNKDFSLFRKRMGVVFQNYRLLDHLSTYENVALPLRLKNEDENNIANNVTELLDWVGLKDHIHKSPATLSGGQKQRVAIARAIINKPELIIADEPTGNVDDVMGLRLLNLFEELNRMGTTILIATHSHQLVNKFHYPIIHLSEGQSFIDPFQTSAMRNRKTFQEAS